MARDRIDVAIGASQKGLMSPPGLATVSLGSRALGRLAQPGQSYYFSLVREVDGQKKGQTGFTPSVPHVRALDVALSMIEKEGKPELFARHRKLQKIAREGLQKMRLKLFNRDDEATIGITVSHSPSGVEVKSWIQELRTKHDLWLAGGQGELEGKIFRLAHFGACQERDLAWALEKIEESL